MLTAIKEKIVADIAQETSLPEGEILSLLEVPKSLDHGHLAMPVFFLAKQLRKAPPVIAKELAEKLAARNNPLVEKVEPVSGFVNFHLKSKEFQEILLRAVQDSGDELGDLKVGQNQTMIIDFSSPNVAKPMSIGHLRATVIGQAIYNLAKTQGYKVIGLNHLGDWGVQFGKLAWAFQKWGNEYDFANKPFESLFQIYVRFHDEAEKDESLNAEGSLVFKKLEQGDPEIHAIWRQFVDISLKEYSRLWGLLGVEHDLVCGESFYNDRLKPTEKLLEDKGLLEESEGAMVVRLDEDKLPPCLIRKSDGASLYATRDIASAIYRMEDLKCDLNLYVVGEDQTLHFRQVFRVMEKMGYPWAKNCHHISFGMYRFKEGRMSTRKGNVIFLEDVLNKAMEMMREIVEEKNPSLSADEKATVARQVGVGAVIFNDLANDRVKNVDFDWDRVLSFEGDSGPYVQYMNVRCLSVLRKYGKPVPTEMPAVLDSEWEKELIRLLMKLEDVLSGAFRQFKPHVVAGYLLDVCQAFSQFYHHCRVLGEGEDLEKSRVALVYCTQKVLAKGLKVLSIEAPEVM
ncbi:MAG: arginine--tRNA ligase [Bdellovibrionaceae bacterium]|nr:arginine--tRNA ligase [Bdellovibrionales bacterium]MCB9083669.1 arginine--tRNA ligase [Pseudobdellovibrionaceae bacterium]